MIESGCIELPEFGFSFTNFSQLSTRVDNKYLTDVVGRLYACSELRNVIKKNGKETGLREMELQDEEGYVLKVTLWGNCAVPFDDQTINNHVNKTVVIVTTSTVKSFNAEYTISSTAPTRIYVNLQIPEVLNVLNSPIRNAIRLRDATEINLQSIEEFSDINKKSLAEIIATTNKISSQVMKFTCKATIFSVLHDYGWSYDACPHCQKKITEENNYECPKHGAVDPNKRYQLMMEIEDDTCSARVIALDLCDTKKADKLTVCRGGLVVCIVWTGGAMCELVVCGLFVFSVWCCTGVTGNASTNIHKIGNQTVECMSLLGNFISGTIPREIGSIATLEELDMQGTNMEGPIPPNIYLLRNLTELRISYLNVSSMDFPDLQELTKLEELVLRSCSITGPIPSYIGERMLNIKKL
ncbi:hypothetical protein IFM89_022032 [Coptis chinensis]|uniref:Replication protein A OB domain-containing protein n=1 Tax=Coptis chinensis TaxID=261450 RepID=A0A835I643_9MAGN|nr:hypothetical protein IFM89_022032 [Coptis chinensis]